MLKIQRSGDFSACSIILPLNQVKYLRIVTYEACAEYYGNDMVMREAENKEGYCVI